MKLSDLAYLCLSQGNMAFEYHEDCGKTARMVSSGIKVIQTTILNSL